MNDKSKRVLAGWLKLSDSERADVEAEINRITNSPTWRRADLREELSKSIGVTRVASGPYGEGCPCCGR
jgi:hypothetical protein